MMVISLETVIAAFISITVAVATFILGVLFGHHREIGERVTYTRCRQNRDNCPCAKDVTSIKQKLGMLLLFFCLLVLVPGCSAVNSITGATKEKTLAAGSDTWGGGAEISVATLETPVPSFSFWFGRRRAWYSSVKDKDTGEAAARIVTASHSPLSVNAGTDGMSVNNSSP